jgi:ketosteroid isomerase-like protein
MIRLALGAAMLTVLATPAFAQAPKPAAPDSIQVLRTQLFAYEKQGWDAAKKRDFTALAALMPDDYQELDQDGLRNKAQSIAVAKDLSLTAVALTDPKLTMVANDVALLTYTAKLTGKFKSDPLPAKPYYYGALYRNRGGQWVCVFFQETIGQ